MPPALETAAQQLLADIAAATVGDVNPFSGKLELIVEPGLTNAAAWYLIGNPALHDGLAHAFLDGQTSPRIETKASWTTLGMEFRLAWAVDAEFIGTSSWYRKANRLGACYKLGRAMIILPEQIDAILMEGQPCRLKSIDGGKPTGRADGSKSTVSRSLNTSAAALDHLQKLARSNGVAPKKSGRFAVISLERKRP